MKERVHFINVLKFICFSAIIYYHTLVECQVREITPMQEKYYMNNNIHMATTAVAMFFMLSGVGLMLSLGRSDKINLRKYYKKRVARILVPYWVSSIIVFFILLGGALAPYPKWRLIFNVFALDGYLSSQGYHVFYMITGEWFMGCLMVMYLLFPLICRLMKARPKLFMIVATVIYIGVVLMYHFNIVQTRTAVFTDLYLKTYEFMLGMHLATVWKRFDKKAFLISIIIFLIYMLIPVSMPIPEGIKITTMATVMFIMFAYLEPWFEKRNILNRFCDTFCKYSYEIFLIHHAVIVYFLNHIWSKGWVGNNVLLIMVLEAALGVISGVILHYMCKYILLGWDALGKMIRRKKRELNK